MQYDLTNLQKKNERRLPAVAKSFLYESKRNFWSYTMKFQIRHSCMRVCNSKSQIVIHIFVFLWPAVNNEFMLW